MRKVWYHQIWIQNYLGFIVSDLTQMPRWLEGGRGSWRCWLILPIHLVSRILLLWSGWRKVRLTFCVTWEASPYCLQVLGWGVSRTVCVRLGLHNGHVASRLGACPGNWAWEGRGRDHPQGHSSSVVSVIWESVTKENGVIGFCGLWLALGASGSRVVWVSPCDSMWHGYPRLLLNTNSVPWQLPRWCYEGC